MKKKILLYLKPLLILLIGQFVGLLNEIGEKAMRWIASWDVGD